MKPTDAKILIVDDEQANVLLLQRLLSQAGYEQLEATTDPREVLRLYQTFHPDLILLDLMMPHLDGLAVLAQLRGATPDTDYVPVLMLTADAALDAKRRALAAGTHDFLTKPFEQFELLLRIRNLLETRRLYLALEAHNRSLEQAVQERTARLLQSEKVAAMGSLLAGVAHELNNPLTVLNGQAQLLLEVADEGIKRRATQIQRAAERCVRIVRNFLALARQRPPERTGVSVGAVIQQSVELLAYELRTDSIDVSIDVAANIPILSADPHQLHQVFVNIIANAHHAMRRQQKARRLRIAGRYDSAGGRVYLEIADSGPGIPPEARARIFEPFFTTKAVGEGTGLGLSLCRGIIEDHGGTMDVAATSEEGTTFVIALPAAIPANTPVAASPSAPSAPVPRGRVLVVDDEPAVADVISEALRRAGHQVDSASNGAEALGALALQRYDLVVSDTKMPVLDGEGFYAELIRRFPELRRRVIFLTGDVLSREKRDFLQQAGTPFLTKPCDLVEMRELVARVMRET
jgi:two-component system NtrC family sensor kinase